MDEGNLPWEGYNSDSLYPGLAHPVRRSDIADALSAAGARVMHVQRALGRQMPDATHLITARFSSNARPRYFSQIVWPNNAYLTLYAVLIVSYIWVMTYMARRAMAGDKRKGPAPAAVQAVTESTLTDDSQARGGT